MTLDSDVDATLAALSRGSPVILMNEWAGFGVLGLPASHASAQSVNLLLQVGRGVLYVALPSQRLSELGLRSTVTANTNPLAMGQTVDARMGVTTGVSVDDRMRTISVLVDEDSEARDLTSPGHVSTVALHEGGVLGRFGISEALSDLSQAVGLGPAIVEINILNDVGGTVDGPGLRSLAAELDIPVLSISDAVRHRRQTDGWESPPPEVLSRIVPYLDGTLVIRARGGGSPQVMLPVSVHRFCPRGHLFGDACSEQDGLARSRQALAATDSAAIGVIVSDHALDVCPEDHPAEAKQALAELIAADLAGARAAPLA